MMNFAPDEDLGFAMLIAEDGEGAYQPVGLASTINEAKEIAQGFARKRTFKAYKLWAHDWEGDYVIVHTFQAAEVVL